MKSSERTGIVRAQGRETDLQASKSLRGALQGGCRPLPQLSLWCPVPDGVELCRAKQEQSVGVVTPSSHAMEHAEVSFDAQLRCVVSAM